MFSPYSSLCNILLLKRIWDWDDSFILPQKKKNVKRGIELIYFLDKLFYKKRTTKFHWKNLLLRTTLKIYFITTTITTSVGWPTVVIGRSGKGYWRRCSFPSYFRYIWHFIPKPNVGNFKGKLIFIFILLANRPTGNNTHKTRIYAVQKQAKMIIMDHSCIGLVLLQCMWNSQSILIPANPNLFLPYIFYFYNNMTTYIVSKKSLTPTTTRCINYNCATNETSSN